MDYPPDALNSLRLLQPIHKSASNLRLLCQVFSCSKSSSGLLIVVVWVMKFRQTWYLVGFSLTKIQERHWLPMSVLDCRAYHRFVVLIVGVPADKFVLLEDKKTRVTKLVTPACYHRACRLAHTAGHLQLDQCLLIIGKHLLTYRECFNRLHTRRCRHQ